VARALRRGLGEARGDAAGLHEQVDALAEAAQVEGLGAVHPGALLPEGDDHR
jgi:hypothetical protein